MFKFLLLALFALVLVFQTQATPCDTLIAANCSTTSKWDAYDCLLGLGESIDSKCQSYLQLINICRADINMNCIDLQFDDALPACMNGVIATKPQLITIFCSRTWETYNANA